MTKIKLLLAILFFSTIVVAQDQPKEEFKPSFKPYTHVFGDYYYKVSSDTNVTWGNTQYAKTPEDFNAFDFRRVYLGVIFDIAPKFQADVLYEGGDDILLSDGKKAAGNLKYAYVKWKEIYKRADLLVGAQNTPTWSRFTEHIWSYRSVEKTIADARKLGSSNDVGVSLSGKFDAAKNFGYELMVGNGTSQKPENNKYKKGYVAVNGKLFSKKLLWEIYGDYEGAAKGKDKMTLKGFLGFSTEKMTIGIETVVQIQQNANIDNTGKNISTTPFGITAYVRGSLIKDKLNAFVRADVFNPDTKTTDSGYQEAFAVVGFDYTPTKNIHIIPNFWVNTYSAKDSKIVNRDPDLVARITFEFKLK